MAGRAGGTAVRGIVQKGMTLPQACCIAAQRPLREETLSMVGGIGSPSDHPSWEAGWRIAQRCPDHPEREFSRVADMKNGRRVSFLYKSCF